MTRAAGRANGFTLIELIVVMIILGLSAAIAVPAFLGAVRQDDLTRAKHQLQAFFKTARDSAIRTGRPVTIVIDSSGERLWYVSGEIRTRDTAASESDGEEEKDDEKKEGAAGGEESYDAARLLGLPTTIRLRVTRARARFEFAPNGTAYGDSLVVDGPLGEWLMILDPWTGDVVVQ